ncbi:MAG: DUF5640 domain-containing protein [Gemmatimonadota bacterium]|nr:DUF5640 domain-containing protein [Gemmatimonadota bacterium]
MNKRAVFRFVPAACVLSVALYGPSVGSLGAQAQSRPQPTPLIGTWRADVALPNGVIQTFRFDESGTFDLAMTLAVDGTYSARAGQLVETVALPATNATHTDTSAFTVAGDSMIVSDRVGGPRRVLHRMAPASGGELVGEWTITLPGGTTAHYTFAADGSMRVRAQVGDEQGRYSVRADTLHLTNEQTFQLPATARFAVSDSVLTLTPLNGKSARLFRKVVSKQ